MGGKSRGSWMFSGEAQSICVLERSNNLSGDHPPTMRGHKSEHPRNFKAAERHFLGCKTTPLTYVTTQSDFTTLPGAVLYNVHNALHQAYA